MHKDFVPTVSIEKFAAYLDGNLTEEGMNEVASAIHSDDSLQDILSSGYMVDETLSTYDDWNQIVQDDIFTDSFDIPNIEENLDASDIFPQNEDSIYAETVDVSYDVDNITVTENDKINTVNTNIQTMTNTIKIGTSNYGETGQNIKDPIFIQQPDDHSCALRSQQIILRDFGIDIPFKDLEKIAKENGVYSDDGTSMCDVGKVLDIAGVGMHQVIGCNMFDLTNELAQGHRVIVGVDANELWYNDSITDKLKNWFDDITGNQGGNHALIVAGVEVNPNNPSDVKVVLTDPGSGDLRIEYPMKQFMDAWKDTNCFMAATDAPAPYQYDPISGMEIPSNFVVEQQFNQFVAENSYQLSPDMINIPQEYQPAYSEHLDVVGDDTYEDFKDQYDNLLEERNLFASLHDSSQDEIETLKETHDNNNVGDSVNYDADNNEGDYDVTDTEDGDTETDDDDTDDDDDGTDDDDDDTNDDNTDDDDDGTDDDDDNTTDDFE
ncbi:hypothetical protein KTQ94_12770 [Prevotella stercorea]|uniref:hypothetical protein n=2 Tax=Leyella stercorea TaxID=363265 RepID=UPI001C2C1ABE|nr:hypothetical protein [Leyella stercorea]MBU9899557.1 hypothetical protein [Leyella stercorea]